MGFVKRRLRIDVPSDIKAITGIYHPSTYCSVTYTDTKITLTSTSPGNAYIYLNGLMKSTDEKAVILYIILVAENGSLSTGEPYIFSKDPNFTKIPTTIQKELGTTSSIEGLDVSEPEDIENPFVNTEEVNQQFEQFKDEDSILPKVFVGFCINKNKWCINYTTDTNITANSNYILYETTYEGLLDCLKTAFSLLTSGRTTKEKVIVITSGTTGTASQNQSSKVNKNNRNYNSVSMQPSSYTILDFQDNYIYVDKSESFISTYTYNINAVINMERGVKYVTICNLTLIGRYTYGIFLAQASNIYMKNIHITIAQGEFESCYIGIRAQSQANAIANVELSRWSHELYFDNCTFCGVEDHGIETFNAYNIWGKRIEATDIGGCGILLNCSYNTWINEVIAIRCCPQATYAATRYANDAGPNINIHYVYGEACGNGVFLVSSSNDIRIDKINLVNIHSTPIYVGGSAGLQIKSGKILTNGGIIKYSNADGTLGSVNATTSAAIFSVNGSSSHFLPQWNDVFENIKIEGFKTGYVERYRMSANYNIYNNIDTSGCQQVKSGAGSGSGTDEDQSFNFAVIDGQKGAGYDEITGDKIVSGDYTYALAKDEESYVIMSYNGSNDTITIPSVYNEKPVSRIGSFSFFANEIIKSVTINPNIKTLGGLCFGACPNLETVIFSEGGSAEVGHCSFRGCKKLKNLDLSGASILRASSFAWCYGLTDVTCPKNVVYFGGNVFYDCNINLTIECDDISLMTVEPYAFYYIGSNSTITFTGVNEPTNVIGVGANSANNYYYYSQNAVENKVYLPGVWCKYYYHVRVPPTFKTS